MEKRMVGVYTDLFDPVHSGHLNAVLSAMESSGMTLVRMVLSSETAEADDEDRWRMLVAACADFRKLIPFRLSSSHPDIAGEIRPEDFLRKEYPDDVLVRIAGNTLPLSVTGIQSAEVRIGTRNVDLISGSVPLPVYEYISASGLYGVPCRVPESRQWLPVLFSALKPHRFAHSLSVAATARVLAERFGEDPDKAEKAGLLHDCAKIIPMDEMRRIVTESGMDVDERMLTADSLLHSAAGACLARTDYGVTDPDIVDAIASHNTGRPGMSRLSMCVCLADSIEPGRPDYPHLDDIRALSEKSLEEALLLSLEGVRKQVISNGWYLHPRTRDTVEWLRTVADGKFPEK